MNELAKNVELIRDDYQVLEVSFELEKSADGFYPKTKTYYYKYSLAEKVFPEDTLVVPARNSFSVVRCVRVYSSDKLLEHPDMNFAWAVGKVSFASYVEAKAIDAKIAAAIQEESRKQKRLQALVSLRETLGEDGIKALGDSTGVKLCQT